MSLTNDGEDLILDDFTNRTLYLGLSTTTPAEDGTSISEPSGNNYSRATVSAGDWAAASGSSITTSAAVSMPVPSGAWGTCTHWVLFDAASAGNAVAFASLDSSVAPTASSTSVTVTPTITMD